MSLYSDPPPLLPFTDVKPSLLVCWWITIFCTTIILFRVGGRYVRTERLFTEDKMAALAIIPLFMRMACVHVVLVYGTNNADFSGVELSDEDIRKKQIASGLVLASRIFYAATLWILKNTILEFFKRLTGVTWQRSYRITLLAVRLTLVLTFIGVIVSDLTECQPFSHYWQVLPDPGGQCRQGYVQLITMAACNILTDLLLIFFPIPIIIRSGMNIKRKIQLVSLFSLSLAVIATTIYRVPHIIQQNGSQQYRSLLASIELLFATAAANALVLGSFVRDRGVKKRKFKYDSTASDSIDRGGGHGPSSRFGSSGRRPTLNQHWGSDEDLVRDLGISVDRSLRNDPDMTGADDERPVNARRYTPAPPVAPDMTNWQFPSSSRYSGMSGGGSGGFGKLAGVTDAGDANLLSEDHQGLSPFGSRSNSTTSPRKVSFFDVGGLLNDDTATIGSGGARRDSYVSYVDPLSPVGPLSGGGMPSPTFPASNSGLRRGSTALLHDLGGLLPFQNGRGSRTSRGSRSAGTELQPIPQGKMGGVPDLIDPGGLLRRP